MYTRKRKRKDRKLRFFDAFSSIYICECQKTYLPFYQDYITNFRVCKDEVQCQINFYINDTSARSFHDYIVYNFEINSVYSFNACVCIRVNIRD